MSNIKINKLHAQIAWRSENCNTELRDINITQMKVISDDSQKTVTTPFERLRVWQRLILSYPCLHHSLFPCSGSISKQRGYHGTFPQVFQNKRFHNILLNNLFTVIFQQRLAFFPLGVHSLCTSVCYSTAQLKRPVMLQELYPNIFHKHTHDWVTPQSRWGLFYGNDLR